MPVYIHLANLIIDKQAISKKYKGGIDQFRKDYISSDQEYNQEDNELFLIARMNVDEFNIDALIENGLDYDEQTSTSNDFVIRPRYGTYLWNVNWIEDNNIFAWHKNASSEEIKKANTIASLSMDQIGLLSEKNINLFETIK